MSTDPAGLSAELAESIRRLAETGRLLVALDFDGTLAPLVDRPSEARVLPETARALAELEVLPDTWVAYVSGRSVEGLRKVIPADDLAFLVGSHGVEVQYGPHEAPSELSDQERTTLAELGDALGLVVKDVPDAFLETKSFGFGVHTRGLDAETACEANEAARRAAASVSGRFTVRDGKDILDFAVRDATKGDGVERVRAHVSATAVLFAGDDVTDEDGFGVLTGPDVGIKVGPGETAAEFRVRDPEDIARLLTMLVGERSARGTTASRAV